MFLEMILKAFRDNDNARKANRKRNLERKPEEYTCFNCPVRLLCSLAWDEYNTDGDCLADK